MCVMSFGTIHAEITWNLSDDGTLTLSGMDMPDQALDYSIYPWHSKRNLIKKVVIENGVTSIGGFAFYVCRNLTSIMIPNSVTSIGNAAFMDCSGFTSITIPNSVTSIGDGAFYGCKGLTSIIIPKSVTSIGSTAFTECTALISVTIPESLISIGDGAFSFCSGLTSITIPNSVTNIGDYAFMGCSYLTSVTNFATTPQKISENTFSVYGTLHVLPGCKAAYEAAEYWKNFTIVEDATTNINVVENPTTNSFGKIFSVSGQLLNSPKKGINIINGRKLLVK